MPAKETRKSKNEGLYEGVKTDLRISGNKVKRHSDNEDHRSDDLIPERSSLEKTCWWKACSKRRSKAK